MEIPFNINHNVKVKLTQRGVDILRQRHEGLCGEVPKLWEFPEPKKDEKGYSEFQMWDLMESLGKHCGPGKELPFETEIVIVAKEP